MEGVDVVIVGCGVPKRSMGWVHLHQLLNLQVFSDVHTIQVVEPFFLDDVASATVPTADRDAALGYLQAHPAVKAVQHCRDLNPPHPDRARLGVIAVRTGDCVALAKEAVTEGGCTSLYVEKPGAVEANDLEDLEKFCAAKGVMMVLGYCRNGEAFAVNARAKVDELLRDHNTSGPEMTNDTVIELLHFNTFDRNEAALSECFSRNSEGFIKNTFSHDIAIAVAHHGLTVDLFCDLSVDTDKSEIAEYGGFRDFVSCSFTLRPNPKSPFLLRFDGGRCRADDLVANIVRSKGDAWEFTLAPIDPTAEEEFPCDVEGLASYFVPQWGGYIRAKRAALDLAVNAVPKNPQSVLQGSDGVQVLRIADKLSALVTAACLGKEQSS